MRLVTGATLMRGAGPADACAAFASSLNSNRWSLARSRALTKPAIPNSRFDSLHPWWVMDLRTEEEACAVRTIRTLGGDAATHCRCRRSRISGRYRLRAECRRESVRRHDGLAAVLPDSIVDLALAGQYGALSPGRCLAILTNNPSTPVPNTAQASRQSTRPTSQPAPVTAQDPMQWAAQVTVQAANECKAKRLRGDLATHAASVQCANAPMLAAFNEAHYRYMDLIEFFAAKRLELAAKIDRGELTGTTGSSLMRNKVYASIQEIERQRDHGAR